jgi:Penicillin binding protein transpeptidase domain
VTRQSRRRPLVSRVLWLSPAGKPRRPRAGSGFSPTTRGDPELVFDFPFNEELNEAVKRLPRRWFDWRRKNWRVPADPRLGRAVEELLGRFPELVPAPEVLAWLTDSGRWKALVSVVSRAGRGAFVLRTISENRAMEGQYPPGSTVKIVSTAALLAAGLSPDEIVECPQFLNVGGKLFHNFE